MLGFDENYVRAKKEWEMTSLPTVNIKRHSKNTTIESINTQHCSIRTSINRERKLLEELNQSVIIYVKRKKEKDIQERN